MKIIVSQDYQPDTEMTEEEFRAWLDMFLADRTMGTEFRAVRRVR